MYTRIMSEKTHNILIRIINYSYHKLYFNGYIQQFLSIIVVKRSFRKCNRYTVKFQYVRRILILTFYFCTYIKSIEDENTFYLLI